VINVETEESNKLSVGFEERRKLIGNTGNARSCFDTNYYWGYADYLLDPFKANNDRGDWG